MQGPSLNAVRVINPDWKARAEHIDALRKKYIDLGPVLGIPGLVKDNVDVLGLPTPAGSIALQKSYLSADAP